MSLEVLPVVYHCAVLLVILVVCWNALVNSVVFARPSAGRPEAGDPSAKPSVSILVPARDEERNIGACLQSLLAQDLPPSEILLLDDRSRDRTRAIAEELGFSTASGARHRILEGAELPPGWTGKAHACHRLAAEAGGDYLLFTDADTVHEPHALRSALDTALSAHASLLSAWPRQVTGTFAERLIIPLVGLLILGFLPQWILSVFQRFPMAVRWLPRVVVRSLGAANGQFLLFQRSAYDAVGGHAGVRDHLVEDVALARAVAARTGDGMRLVNCDGAGIVRCRMYHSAGEIWEGFTKNLRPAFEGSSAMFFFSIAVQFFGFVLPFFLLPFAAGFFPLVAVQVFLILALRAGLTLRFGTSPWSAVLQPFAHGWALVIALNSWWQWSRGGVTWKGRAYLRKP